MVNIPHPISMTQVNVTQFTDCLILRDHQLIKEDLWISEGKIINPGPLFFQNRRNATKKEKCNGSILAPGFIDLQINGAFGVDFRYISVTFNLNNFRPSVAT